MILKLENVRKSYAGPDGNNRTILENLDLVIEAGDFISITGPSGCGKSTLLSIAGCLLKPNQGQVELMGNNTTSLRDRELSQLRNRWLGFVFQSSHLIPTLTVLENVMIPKTFARDDAHESEQKVKKRASGLLEELGIDNQASMLPYQLSLGQRRRVALARALINQPKLILADEPTGDLDLGRARQVADLLQLSWRKGVSLLTVTNEPWLAALAPKRFLLEGKKLIRI